MPRLWAPSLEYGLGAGLILSARVLRAPVRHRQDKWVLSGNRFENSEEEENLGSFDAKKFSALSKNAASASVSDDSWKKLSKIYVLLFNARTDNEGLCELITSTTMNTIISNISSR